MQENRKSLDLPKISIITRCRNRLEYTVQVMDAVKRRTVMPYEHIVIDNASTDGTYEWFTWMSKHTSWYTNVRYFRMDRNCGDWGGMLAGAKQAKGEFIVQLDNDIIPCENWLTYLHKALILTRYQVVMLKRANVFGKWILKPLSSVETIEGMEIARVERAVACYIMTREDFMSLNIPERRGLYSKYDMAKKLQIGKILNRTCYELEADKEMIIAKLDQRTKYNPEKSEIWEKV